MSPTISRLRLARSIIPLNNVRSVQTDITLNDVVLHKNSVLNELSSTKDVPLKRCETREIVPNCNFYKEHLQNEVLGWLLNVPIFYSTEFTTKYLKDNIVNGLVDKIDRMKPQDNNKKYEEKVKDEIESCLNRLPMWLPNTVSDQTLFKNGLRNKLFNKIKQLNTKFLGIEDDNDDLVPNLRSYTKVEDVELNHDNNEIIMKEIHIWLAGIKFTRAISRKRVIDLMMKKILPLLNVPVHTRSHKLMLKGEIVDILDELPIHLANNENKNIILNKFAEELANRLLSIQIKLEAHVKHKFSRSREIITQQCASRIIGVPIYNSRIRLTVYDKVNKALGNAKIYGKHGIKEEICDTILNSLETLRSGVENNINNEIYEILRRTNSISEEKAKNIAKKIKLYVKIALKQEKEAKKSNSLFLKPQLSGVLSIYRSNSNTPITSTPKKANKKDIPKLNPEEKSYMNNVAALIRAWMETLPNNFDDDKNYKEIMINDLAGDIMDEVKREQLSPESNTEKELHLNFIVHRWLFRFYVFDDLNDAKPQIEDFLAKLKQIPEPTLTAPQHGTRQAMHYLKRIEQDFDYDEEFVPRGIDVLEDQISVWMNEQPSEIYAYENKKKRSKMVKDLALTLQDRLSNKSPENEIERDINQWLKQIIKSKEKEHVGLLTQDLKEKIINVPQDKTLEERHEKRKRQRAEYFQNEPSTANSEAKNVSSTQEDPDKTMKEFIMKYIEHNYDIEDPMARGAFAQLLKIELRKLSLPTRREVYDNFAKETVHQKFMPEKLNEVLEYVKMISDWLRNIPVESFYNTVGNMARIDFVNDLARNIQEVEEQRKEYPNDMDYDNYISSVISRSIRTYNVPLLAEQKQNEPLMVNQLLLKIIANRSAMPQNDSNISDIKEQNLSEFIEEYIRVNGRDIADDELKLEAWTAQLQKEIKKMIHEGADPSTLSKGQVYEKFSKVPIPGKESIRRFSLEIAFVKDISNWIKNLPLLPIDNVPDAQEERINMITELAQKIADREVKRNADSTNKAVDDDLIQYISDWIAKLPLDPRKSIVESIVIQQLMNKIDNVNSNNETLPNEPEPELKLNPKLAKTTKDPGAHIVEFIENWCNELPIKGDNPDEIKAMKNNVAKNLYQKICELNVDPRVLNDDILYKNLLEDEIDTQFENLPQDPELQNRGELLKTELLNTILDMKKIIDHKSVGDNYKHKLEITIDAAIPDPIQSRQITEPGFEMYKNHLANMFILQNFDHSNEKIKAKYENKIREEVNKYFTSAQNKNALPVTREEMLNELYSELFKVPMPNKEAIIDEVEEVKTRCEVEAWFEELPLREADGICEYLEWDQIVSALAKRIHELEKNESTPDENVKKEIIKWLAKLPLLPGQERYVNQFAEKLQAALKSSKEDRKYVPPNSKGKAIIKREGKRSPNTSQVAGPYRKGETWISSLSLPQSVTSQPNNEINHTPKKKSGIIIEEIVDDWCNQLPIVGDQTQNKIIKDNVSTQLVKKICELNMDADIFNDDIIYDQLLDEELEKIMAGLVGCCGLAQSKRARKYQLKEMIRSVKPLIKEEKKRHEYKTELNNTVTNILKDHDDTKAKIAEFNKLKEDIVDYFVEYNYNKNDDDAKQVYKEKVHDAVVKYIMDVQQNKDEQVDPLVRRNQLLCELSKIPVPNHAVLKDEVEEIRMKNEVEQFFENNALDDQTEKTSLMKKTLTKRLNDLEKTGHSESNDKKMSSEIAKCLNKLNKTVAPSVIKDFVNTLKNNEAARKSPPQIKIMNGTGRLENTGTYHPHVTICPGCQQTIIHQPEPPQQAQYLHVPPQHDMSQPWVSLPPATLIPNQAGIYNAAYVIRGIRAESDTPRQPPANQSQNQLNNYDNQNPPIWPQDNICAPCHASLRQSVNMESMQRGESAQIIDVNDPADSQVYPVNAYAEYVIEEANRNANQYPQGQGYHPYPPTPLPDQTNGYFESSIFNFAAPVTADLSQGQLLSYDRYKPLFSSTAQGYVSRRPPSSGHISPYSASSNQRSIYEMPVHGQVATPRIVQGEAQQYDPSIAEDITPESLFQGPAFTPRPLYSPLTVPAGADSYHATRPTSGRTSRRGSNTAGLNRDRYKEGREAAALDNERYRCRCDKKLKKYDSGPYCMIPMDEYCDDCGGFCPMWCRMPLPACFYLH